MEYQHLVFEEFGRKVVPAIRPFHVYSTDINPAIEAEFAHAVYRFGHSMLDDQVARKSTKADGTEVNNDVPLLTAFLSPPEFFNNAVDPAHPVYSAREAAGAIVMGSSDQTGNEIDEFVTETLRNNLLGLPLDLPVLNMARARSEGIPRLNQVRRDIHARDQRRAARALHELGRLRPAPEAPAVARQLRGGLRPPPDDPRLGPRRHPRQRR